MPLKLDHQNSILRVCVDGTKERVSGRVYSQRLTEPLPFSDSGSLLLKLEDLLERQDFPQAYQRIRSFSNQGPERGGGELPEGGLTAEETAAARGEAGTFELVVLTRRNASWQGTVNWLDGSGNVEFTSDLEFLNLVETRYLRQTEK